MIERGRSRKIESSRPVLGGRSGADVHREAGAYRFDCPRTSFLTFFLAEPRGVVRFALGAAFLRAARFSFLRSFLSSILVVSATPKPLSRESFIRPQAWGVASFMVAGIDKR
jgi:hypothetical protein